MTNAIIILTIIGIVIGLPFAFIVSLNVLFDLGVGYGWSEWLSSLFIVAVFGASRQMSRKE
jgi:hypothetical protein